MQYLKSKNLKVTFILLFSHIFTLVYVLYESNFVLYSNLDIYFNSALYSQCLYCKIVIKIVDILNGIHDIEI